MALNLFSAAASAQTFILDFDSVDLNQNGLDSNPFSDFTILPSSLSEDGFTVTKTNGTSFQGINANLASNNSTIISTLLSSEPTVLTNDDGNTFSISSIEISNGFGREPRDVTFTGFLFGGGEVNQVFEVNSLDTSVFYFNDTFVDLTAVSFSTLVAFDNIKVSVSAVPEPASWLMMIVGFAGVGLMRRRRQYTEFA